MADKKTEVITIRVTISTRKALEYEAEKREWTTSKLAEKILSSWAEEEEKSKLSINFYQNQINNVNIK